MKYFRINPHSITHKSKFLYKHTMKKLLITLFVSGIIFSQSFGQISIQVSPSYTMITKEFESTGAGIEAGIRFRSSKIVRWGFDVGYYGGKIRKTQFMIGPNDGPFPINSGEHYLFPTELIIEIQSPQKHRFQIFGSAGLGRAIATAKAQYASSDVRALMTYSLQSGISYRISERIRFIGKWKQFVGVKPPQALFSKYNLYSPSRFLSTNFSFGINYQFK
jgi:hypothetical protein